MRRRRSRRAEWKGIGSYGTIGLEMVLSVLFGMFGGRFLDSRLGTAPYLMILGFGFGVAAAVRALLRARQEMQHETARDGFRESDTDRTARFALKQREAEAGVDPAHGSAGEVGPTSVEEGSDERST